jgi:hypothetical protein
MKNLINFLWKLEFFLWNCSLREFLAVKYLDEVEVAFQRNVWNVLEGWWQASLFSKFAQKLLSLFTQELQRHSHYLELAYKLGKF